MSGGRFARLKRDTERYEKIAGMRHFPNVEALDAFNRIMLGWLEARKTLS